MRTVRIIAGTVLGYTIGFAINLLAYIAGEEAGAWAVERVLRHDPVWSDEGLSRLIGRSPLISTAAGSTSDDMR